MSAFAASSWAVIAAVAHELEREASGLALPVARTLRSYARRLHTARRLGRHLLIAANPPPEAPPTAQRPLQAMQSAPGSPAEAFARAATASTEHKSRLHTVQRPARRR